MDSTNQGEQDQNPGGEDAASAAAEGAEERPAAEATANAFAELDWLPLGQGVRILAAHEAGLVALEKPVGVLSHPNRTKEQRRSLLTCPYRLEEQVFEVGERAVHLLHRLDSATSGVLLIALDERLADAVRAAFAEDKVSKTYLAVVKGRPSPNVGIWTDKLRKARKGGQVRAQTGSGGLPAKTQYRWRRSDPNGVGLSLVELLPQTGRTHQLRAQCERHECPILGDKTYGDFSWNRRVFAVGAPDRLYLHAARLALEVKFDGQMIRFEVESPPPGSFAKLMSRDPALRNGWRGELSAQGLNEPLWRKTQRQLKARPDPLKQFRRGR
ncbi:MAG: RluA family pseudouridine synthase [Opitutales bacterium]